MFDASLYTARRQALRAKLTGGLVLFPGNSESPMNYPLNNYAFRQDSTFLYFFGLSQPDYVGVLDLDSAEDILFGDDYTIDDVIWMGSQPSMVEQGERVGVCQTAPLSALQPLIHKAQSTGRRIHFLPPYRAESKILLSSLLDIDIVQLAEKASVELAIAVVALREIKDAWEIAEMEQACDIATRMHITAMAMARPGLIEQQIAGAIESIALQTGAGVSFASIVTQNGETLHNHYYGNRLEEGRLLLVDAGAESNRNYCSDFTRTLPVSGRFSTKQKEIYDIVLAANALAFELARPDAFYWQIHNAASCVLVEGLKALGLMRGDTQEAVAAGAQALFMPHGLGHQIGLDVHDMENIGEKYVGYDEETLRSSTPGLSALRMGKRLRAGQVITVEPGIYFIPAWIEKWEQEGAAEGFINFARVREYLDFGGIRIEDNLLVTPQGNRIMGAVRPPASTTEIEECMAQHRR